MLFKIYKIYNKNNPGKEIEFKEIQEIQTNTNIRVENKNKIIQNLKDKINNKFAVFIMRILSPDGKYSDKRMYIKINFNIIEGVWNDLDKCIAGNLLDINRIRSNIIIFCINTKHKIGKTEFTRTLKEYTTWYNKQVNNQRRGIKQIIRKIFPIFKVIKH